MGRLEGKVAIITGAASGIGRASALLFSKEGAHLSLADIADGPGQGVAEQITAEEGDAIYIPTDVSQAADVRRLVETTIQKYGKLDVLFSNAGIDGPFGPLTELSEEDWDRIIDINLKGMFLCAKFSIPLMLANGKGSIIFTGSVNSLVAELGCPAYIASKGGVLMLAKAIATDHGKDHIRANTICPSFVRTPLLEHWFDIQKDAEAARRAAYQRTVLFRLAEAEEIARAAVFLASDESSYVTGSALMVDGGFTTAK